MDDIVKQAMAKWPNVPDCFGWLGLDARGDWYLRDDAAQAAGVFPETAAARGAVLRHEQLLGFIARNYQGDEEGRWFFQNGPQRVYVELEAAPFVWRVDSDGSVNSHTGLPAGEVSECLVDERGRLYLVTALGCGLVHTLDMLHAAEAVESGAWQPRPVTDAELERRCGFQRHPVSGKA
ncbi:DUF2946 family protein [Xylophilus sp. GOD-11R]|uniref:DUF2946 family protein n=1 Tax=Xylophilus sp. GOD-11R TaxID=3089814 RepID=UPI00298C2628|nr:DUF2946 family protein [Xylophilus sp. GOD-11R]WPB56746.1 DUF2946 family protein [Xylophilus sp. GOD-11R]